MRANRKPRWQRHVAASGGLIVLESTLLRSEARNPSALKDGHLPFPPGLHRKTQKQVQRGTTGKLWLLPCSEPTNDKAA